MTLRRLAWTVAAVAVCSTVITSQAPSGHALFEQALAKERVEGNLPEAIRLYERVVAEFASDRALAAQALVQVGLCYEKLGRDEAVRAYERLVRDFADQEDAVERARVRLTALKRPPLAAASAAAPAVRAFPRVDETNAVLALSPDGTKAAFLTFDKGQNLAIYDVATRLTTRLTDFTFTPSPANAIADIPVWSPDSRRIAYMQCPLTRDSRCELRVATPGGEPSVIFRNEPATDTLPPAVFPAGWLPDGAALVAVLGRADKTFSIGLVPTAGGAFTPVRSLNGWAGRYPEVPSVSPDGRLIAFSEGSQGMRDIHVVSTDGRTAHRITDHPADDHRPVWSPDGRHLAFVSNRDGMSALWSVAIKNGQAAEPVRVKEGLLTPLGWTARGLAYSERVRTDNIYLVPVDSTSGEPNGVPRLISYRRTGQNIEPAWSPDGRYLAFVSSSPAEPGRHAVVLLPSAGGEAREFPLPIATTARDLRWFGNSRGLGLLAWDARGERALFRLMLATGEWKTFLLPSAVDAFGTRFEWNSDGSGIFYARSDFRSDDPAILEWDLQSNRERVVFQGSGIDRYRGLRFSPDRRLLAFRGISDQQGIVILDLDSGRSRVIHDKAAGDTYTYTDTDSVEVPTWSPNGRALLVNRTENPRTNKQATVLRLIPVDGGAVRQIPLGAELTRLLSTGRGGERPSIGDLAWSPAGDRLAFVLSAQTTETFVIENALALAGMSDTRASR